MSLIVYFLVGFQATAAKFFIFLADLIVLNHLCLHWGEAAFGAFEIYQHIIFLEEQTEMCIAEQLSISCKDKGLRSVCAWKMRVWPFHPSALRSLRFVPQASAARKSHNCRLQEELNLAEQRVHRRVFAWYCTCKYLSGWNMRLWDHYYYFAARAGLARGTSIKTGEQPRKKEEASSDADPVARAGRRPPTLWKSLLIPRRCSLGRWESKMS